MFRIWNEKWAGLLMTTLLGMCCLRMDAQDPSLPAPTDQRLGTINGIVLDPSGAAIAGAVIKLMANPPIRPVQIATKSEGDGHFTFKDVAPGPFQLSITSSGFAVSTADGSVESGKDFDVPPVELSLASALSEIRVTLSQQEIAQEQIEEAEKQRILGIFPNFFVTYFPNAAPLTPKQKFRLAWKQSIDPFTFGVTGLIAGIQQANNTNSGFGQGAQGYAKRYGANYGGAFTSTMIGNAILPSLLKQDPRYFQKGTGTVRSRILYALAFSVRCKGDNGRWQFNYSGILGGLAAGGISRFYYPAEDRNGAGLMFRNTGIGIAANAGGNILQEFLIRKFTPKRSSKSSGKDRK